MAYFKLVNYPNRTIIWRVSLDARINGNYVPLSSCSSAGTVHVESFVMLL